MSSQKAIADRIIDILGTNSDIKQRGYFSMRNWSLWPAFAVRQAGSSQQWVADDLKQKIVNYEIVGYILPLEGGIQTYSEQAVITWIDTIDDLFDTRPTLGLTGYSDAMAGVQDSFIVTNTGFFPLTVSNSVYAACIWTLQVTLLAQLQKGF